MNRNLRRIIVCRGCCCGVATGRAEGAAKRLERLESLKNVDFEISTSNCLGPCSQGDMLVLIAKSENIKLWFSGMHISSLNELFIKWIEAGLPPLVGEFELLKLQVIKPNKQNREAINEHLSCVS